MSLKNNQEQILKLLTPRERQVYLSIIKGNTDIEVGKELNISIHTAKTHAKNIYQKLNVRNRLEAAFLYYRMD